MADAKAAIGFGTIILFGTSGFTAEILDIDLDDVATEAFDASHMGTAAPAADELGNIPKLFSQLIDSGGFSFDMHYDPSEIPPITGVEETITITLVSGTTLSGLGAMMRMGVAIPYKGKMTANASVTWNGPVTVVPAA